MWWVGYYLKAYKLNQHFCMCYDEFHIFLNGFPLWYLQQVSTF